MNIQISTLVLAGLMPALLLFGWLDTAGQTKSFPNPKAVRKVKPKTSSKPVAESPAKLSPQAAPVEIVNLAESDYLSGEASVTVNPKQPTVIRLGLAQNAVSIIEFPASDGIYYIHEGNPKFASVFQSPTKETDRSITVYPGESFLPPRDGSTALSKLVGSGPAQENEKTSESRPLVEHPIQSAYALLNQAGRTNEKKKQGRKVSESEISTIANKKLAEAIRDSKTHLASWTKPQAGLELGVTRVAELDSETRLVIAAVRNVTAANLRLVTGSPELQVQTTDSGGNSIQTMRLDVQYIESTTLEGLVQPGSTVYYAMVYKAPILGTNQTVRVLVAHREAADVPLSSSLSNRATRQ
ncbi:MAG: hypothetical protein DYH05_14730 [Acidobacteria bacterium ACB1]|nr:hypothetical protein [Acidobacteria bacterium ACB1]